MLHLDYLMISNGGCDPFHYLKGRGGLGYKPSPPYMHGLGYDYNLIDGGGFKGGTIKDEKIIFDRINETNNPKTLKKINDFLIENKDELIETPNIEDEEILKRERDIDEKSYQILLDNVAIRLIDIGINRDIATEEANRLILNSFIQEEKSRRGLKDAGKTWENILTENLQDAMQQKWGTKGIIENNDENLNVSHDKEFLPIDMTGKVTKVIPEVKNWDYDEIGISLDGEGNHIYYVNENPTTKSLFPKENNFDDIIDRYKLNKEIHDLKIEKENLQKQRDLLSQEGDYNNKLKVEAEFKKKINEVTKRRNDLLKQRLEGDDYETLRGEMENNASYVQATKVMGNDMTRTLFNILPNGKVKYVNQVIEPKYSIDPSKVMFIDDNFKPKDLKVFFRTRKGTFSLNINNLVEKYDLLEDTPYLDINGNLVYSIDKKKISNYLNGNMIFIDPKLLKREKAMVLEDLKNLDQNIDLGELKEKRDKYVNYKLKKNKK